MGRLFLRKNAGLLQQVQQFLGLGEGMGERVFCDEKNLGRIEKCLL
jgi:hypothetical protein